MHYVQYAEMTNSSKFPIFFIFYFNFSFEHAGLMVCKYMNGEDQKIDSSYFSNIYRTGTGTGKYEYFYILLGSSASTTTVPKTFQ